MTTSPPNISRDELEDMASALVKSASLLAEILNMLSDYDADGVISELSDADHLAGAAAYVVANQILEDARRQFKGKPKKKADGQ